MLPALSIGPLVCRSRLLFRSPSYWWALSDNCHATWPTCNSITQVCWSQPFRSHPASDIPPAHVERASLGHKVLLTGHAALLRHHTATGHAANAAAWAVSDCSFALLVGGIIFGPARLCLWLGRCSCRLCLPSWMLAHAACRASGLLLRWLSACVYRVQVLAGPQLLCLFRAYLVRN
jgi:hypothetical protein